MRCATKRIPLAAAFCVLTSGLAGMASTQPSALVRSADVADVSVGGSLDVNGATYVVAELQPDGTGMTTLLLEKAAA